MSVPRVLSNINIKHWLRDVTKHIWRAVQHGEHKTPILNNNNVHVKTQPDVITASQFEICQSQIQEIHWTWYI